ncbi:unnamed protein product [Chrysodeixis includens]|uniref:Uncharacterized protein n=1 Tax=Chrysodeixis includens TaxID=689277 RepID=A0A9N8Q206_CHRIL|nr:unnamed protein product [Chrysodeixis includens]
MERGLCPAVGRTFCVVSKRFRKNYIHRFTATRSLFWYSPWSPVRRACVYLSTNQYFDYFVMATILLNCVFLAMSETIEEADIRSHQIEDGQSIMLTNVGYDGYVGYVGYGYGYGYDSSYK